MILDNKLEAKWEMDDAVDRIKETYDENSKNHLKVGPLKEAISHLNKAVKLLSENNQSAKESKETNSIKINGEIYPIKPRSFLEGKITSYSNEYGLEHIYNVTYKGRRYEIYGSSFENMSHADQCAVLAKSEATESLQIKGQSKVNKPATESHYVDNAILSAFEETSEEGYGVSYRYKERGETLKPTKETLRQFLEYEANVQNLELLPKGWDLIVPKMSASDSNISIPITLKGKRIGTASIRMPNVEGFSAFDVIHGSPNVERINLEKTKPVTNKLIARLEEAYDKIVGVDFNMS